MKYIRRNNSIPNNPVYIKRYITKELIKLHNSIIKLVIKISFLSILELSFNINQNPRYNSRFKTIWLNIVWMTEKIIKPTKFNPKKK